jgi:hypothetical protein
MHEKSESTQLTVISPERAVLTPEDLVLTPLVDIQLAKARLKEFQEFVAGYLVDGKDFGIIPGTEEPTLLKPGADKLCEIYGLADTYEIIQQTEDWERNLFDYTIRCILTNRRTGALVSTGLGSCNSYESRYRWRWSKRHCPACESESIHKKKNDSFFCAQKEGGCGKDFKADDERIVKQKIERVENEDLASLKNTVLKMSKKRSKVDATLSATRSSGLFNEEGSEDEEEGHSGGIQSSRQKTSAGSKEERKTKEPAKSGTLDPGLEFDRLNGELVELAKSSCFSDEYRYKINRWLSDSPTAQQIKNQIAATRNKIEQSKASRKPAESQVTITDDDLPSNLQPASGAKA